MIFYFDIHPDFFPISKTPETSSKLRKTTRWNFQVHQWQNVGNPNPWCPKTVGIVPFKPRLESQCGSSAFTWKWGKILPWKLGRVLELGVLIYLPDIASSPWNFLRNLYIADPFSDIFWKKWWLRLEDETWESEDMNQETIWSNMSVFPSFAT